MMVHPKTWRSSKVMNAPAELGGAVGVGGAPERSAAATPKNRAARTTAIARGETVERGGGRSSTLGRACGRISAFHGRIRAGRARRTAVRPSGGGRRGPKEVDAPTLVVRGDHGEVVDDVPQVERRPERVPGRVAPRPQVPGRVFADEAEVERDREAPRRACRE